MLALAVAVAAPSALAGTPLPDQRTHVDPAGSDESPRLTLLAADTDAADVRRGYLYVKARCSRSCTVEVSAKTKGGGRNRTVAFKRQTLPARRVRRIRLRIRSEVRDRVSPHGRFVFRAMAYPPF